ncbi:MAG TPA: secondary thiamine-phosphate synthase enzyme YjbQ [Spirochaetia bacterium]|nr:secondary thiamine-phosphate synthase enzyme YjbQ [Spirochaetia bacterium]
MSYTTHALQTSRRSDYVDITRSVREAVKNSGIRQGICVVYVPHTTAGVTVNEHADPAVARDMMKHFDFMVPEEHEFTHEEGNADSHIKTTLTGPSVTLIVDNGDLVLGTWQGVFFCEYDGPRSRHYAVKVVAG